MDFPMQNQYPENAHQQAVFRKAQELLRDRNILAKALSKDGISYLKDNASDDYMDQLAKLIIEDDADRFGRYLLDQVIHYVWAIAEQEVTKQISARTH